MKVLVINAGSSSLKYQLIDMDTVTVMAKGLCERIGIAGSKLTHKNLVKGIAVGVDVETPNLQENLEKNLGDVTAGLQTTLDVESAKLNISNDGAGAVNLGGLSFHIDKFINNTDKDMQSLVEEAMEIAEEYIVRKGGVFA